MAAADSPDYRRYVTTERLPQYPEKARQDHLTGSGIIGVTINPGTGGVTAARVVKSTGHKILDDAAMKACHGFGFVPGTIATAEIPVAFSPAGAWFPAYNTSDSFAVHTPAPSVPSYVRDHNWNGNGIALVEVDRDSGLVTKAYMKSSTGNKVLDNIALGAFRGWRFKPGTISQCEVDVRFQKGWVSTHTRPTAR